MYPLVLLVFFQLFLHIQGKTVDIPERIIAWTPEIYPKLQCHKGYDQFATDGGGERILRELATRVCLESMAGCYKRCIFEYLGILQGTSVVDEGTQHYGKIYFEPEDWIAENLAFLLFTAEENDSGKQIANALYTKCSATMQKLNEMSKPPTCHEQNELYLCMEKAMNCPGVQFEKTNLVTKACSFQDQPFHYYSDKADAILYRLYNETYPDVSCHPGYDSAATSKAISILSDFCSRSLRGCFKRCLFEQLGVLEYIMQPPLQLYRIGFRREEDIAESLQFYLFPAGDSQLGEKIADQITNDCENLIEMFSDMMTPPSCKEENELYLCIEKAMGCPGKSLQKGILMTKVCTLEQVEYYDVPEVVEDKDVAD